MATPFSESLLAIGQIAKTIGYKGNVLIDSYPGYEQTWNTLNKCLIKVDGVWAPFFVTSIRSHADLVDVQFEDLPDDKAARVIVQQEVFVFPDQVSPDEDEVEINDSEWIGFTVIDTEAGQIGEIISVKELPGQDLAIVNYLDRTVSIPLAEELIVDIDLDKKVVILNLPYGLLDL